MRQMMSSTHDTMLLTENVSEAGTEPKQKGNTRVRSYDIASKKFSEVNFGDPKTLTTNQASL